MAALSGAAHPHFNAALTTEDREIGRKYDTYYAWRLQVFERDAFVCQRCEAGGTGVYVIAHHVVSYHAAPELRLDVDNGFTLCRDCHIGFHRAFGFRNNTQEQLALWLLLKALWPWT